MSLWVAGAFRFLFTSCLAPHHHHSEGGGGFAEWVIMQDGGQVLVAGLYSGARNVKDWRINGERRGIGKLLERTRR